MLLVSDFDFSLVSPTVEPTHLTKTKGWGSPKKPVFNWQRRTRILRVVIVVTANQHVLLNFTSVVTINFTWNHEPKPKNPRTIYIRDGGRFCLGKSAAEWFRKFCQLTTPTLIMEHTGRVRIFQNPSRCQTFHTRLDHFPDPPHKIWEEEDCSRRSRVPFLNSRFLSDPWQIWPRQQMIQMSWEHPQSVIT